MKLLKKALDTITLILILILTPLTLTILFTWNTQQGDRLYPVKNTLTQTTGQVLGLISE